MRCSVKLVTTSTRAGLSSSRSLRSASMPSMPGILTSIRTTSGRSSSARGDALGAVGGLAHHLDVVLHLQERAQAAADDLVVVDEQHADRLSATGHLHLDRGALAGLRFHGQRAADAARPVAHRDQAQVAARPADRRGSKPLPSSVTRSRAPWPRRVEGHVDVLGAGVPQGVVQGLLGDPQHGLLLGGGQGPDAVAVEGDARGVGAVEDLDLGAQGGDQAVLVQGGGAQLDDGGAQFVGGLGGERGDLVQLVLGAGRVAVDQGGGGLGGEAQGEELLG